jgi:hypothetical protein
LKKEREKLSRVSIINEEAATKMKELFSLSKDDFKKLDTKCKLYKSTVERLQKDKKKTKDKL